MERMTQSQKRSYKRHHGLIDDVTGIRYRPQEVQQLIIGHIKPIAIGGCNDPENLFLTHRDNEDKINDLAYRIAENNPELIHSVMEQLTRSILQLNEVSNFYNNQLD